MLFFWHMLWNPPQFLSRHQAMLP
uniref:Uncharacterized protein n=1 Tax=Anguilla anguilla TaxID=7936 RepID=A0A0E9V7G2_ANGAN